MPERTDTQRLIERILVAFTLAHFGHPGIPGAPDDSCPRCNAERALDSLADALVAAEARAEQAEHDLEGVHLALGEADIPRAEGNDAPLWSEQHRVRLLHERELALKDAVAAGDRAFSAALWERDKVIVQHDAAEQALRKIAAVVDEQAEDEALWAIYPDGTQPISEAYLQQELRRLHAAVEAAEASRTRDNG